MIAPVTPTTTAADALARYLPLLTLDNFCTRDEPDGSPPQGAIQHVIAQTLATVRAQMEKDLADLGVLGEEDLRGVGLDVCAPPDMALALRAPRTEAPGC